MRIRVKLFARFKDLADCDTLEIDVPAPAAVGDLRRRLRERFPQTAGLLERSAVAVNNELVEDDCLLTDYAEVALLPPVSGG